MNNMQFRASVVSASYLGDFKAWKNSGARQLKTGNAAYHTTRVTPYLCSAVEGISVKLRWYLGISARS
jgi:hypothetical protein